MTWGYRATQTQPEFCLEDSVHCWHCPPIPESRKQMRLKCFFLEMKRWNIFFISLTFLQSFKLLTSKKLCFCLLWFLWCVKFFPDGWNKITYYSNKLKRKSWLVVMDAWNQSKYSLLIIFNSLQIPTQLYR